MGFFGGILKFGGKALHKTATLAGNAASKLGHQATKLGGAATRAGGKIVNSKAILKDATGRKAESLSFIDKKFQEATGLAKKGADGAMQYKTLTKGGFGALAAFSMLNSTGKAISDSSYRTSRGMVSVADNMERFVSYDGSGFINNVDDVAGGDPAILNDIVNHTFTSQRSVISDNSLNDIVFALHANREG